MKQSEIKTAYVKHRDKLIEERERVNGRLWDYGNWVAFNMAVETDFLIMSGIDRKDFLAGMGDDYQQKFQCDLTPVKRQTEIPS